MKDLELGRLRIVEESCWVVGRNAGLLCRSQRWPGWSRILLKNSCQPLGTVVAFAEPWLFIAHKSGKKLISGIRTHATIQRMC